MGVDCYPVGGQDEAMRYTVFILMLVLSGCVTGPKEHQGGRYIWQADPPIPGVMSAAEPQDAPLSFEDEIEGKWTYEGSSVRDLPGGWRGPAFEKLGMRGMWVVFFQTQVQKPGILFLSEDLKEWKTAYIPAGDVSHQVLWYPSKIGQSAVVGMGPPLMLKVANGRTFFFAYQPYEE